MNFSNVVKKDAAFPEQADRVRLDLLPAAAVTSCVLAGC